MDEQGRISHGEEIFELWRRRLGLWLAAPLGIAAWLASGGTPDAQKLAGIMAFTAVLWISEAIPVAVTGLCAAALIVLTGVAGPKDAFQAFATPLLFLFVGSFFIAEAMRLHGLGERLARAICSVARGRLGILCALSGTAWFISLWISNTAATAVTLPIALAVAQSTGDKRFGAALVLSIAYGASMGGIGTPIGTPPNLIGIAALRERAGVELHFFEWMRFGLPIAAVMLALLWGLLAIRFRVRGEVSVSPAQGIDRKPWSRGEVAVGVVFAAAVALWLLPGIFAIAGPAPAARWTSSHLPEEVVGLLCAAPLFVWPVGTPQAPRPALTWQEATRIDWGTILLFGAGIMLGDQAGKTGLAALWGDAMVAATGVDSLWGITALCIAAAIVLSEATNNTATATLMLPLAIALAKAAQVSPIPPAIGATIGASFGFMLPISTAPNAMAYGTGQVTIRQMTTAGIAFDLLGFLVVLGALRLLCPLLGLA